METSLRMHSRFAKPANNSFARPGNMNPDFQIG